MVSKEDVEIYLKRFDDYPEFQQRLRDHLMGLLFSEDPPEP